MGAIDTLNDCGQFSPIVVRLFERRRNQLSIGRRVDQMQDTFEPGNSIGGCAPAKWLSPLSPSSPSTSLKEWLWRQNNSPVGGASIHPTWKKR
jgi:hypothetical protein